MYNIKSPHENSDKSILPIGLSLASEVNLHMMLSSAVDHILN